MPKQIVSTAVCTVLVAAVAAPQTAIAPYRDSFENPHLSKFWSVTQLNGSVAPSTTLPHTGSHSASFTAGSGGQRQIELTHKFGSQVKGRFSLMMYDSFAGVEGLYFQMGLANSKNPAWWASVGTEDFCGTAYMAVINGQGAGAYCANPDYAISPVQRANGWHHMAIDVLADRVTVSIDGRVAFSLPVVNMSIDTVKISLSGPSWRPSVNPYVDDFEFQPLN